jgi:hypothetical protein
MGQACSSLLPGAIAAGASSALCWHCGFKAEQKVVVPENLEPNPDNVKVGGVYPATQNDDRLEPVGLLKFWASYLWWTFMHGIFFNVLRILVVAYAIFSFVFGCFFFNCYSVMKFHQPQRWAAPNINPPAGPTLSLHLKWTAKIFLCNVVALLTLPIAALGSLLCLLICLPTMLAAFLASFGFCQVLMLSARNAVLNGAVTRTPVLINRPVLNRLIYVLAIMGFVSAVAIGAIVARWKTGDQLEMIAQAVRVWAWMSPFAVFQTHQILNTAIARRPNRAGLLLISSTTLFAAECVTIWQFYTGGITTSVFDFVTIMLTISTLGLSWIFRLLIDS